MWKRASCRAAGVERRQVTELVVLGRAIKSLYGAPRTLNGVAAGTRNYIVQSRPITAPPPTPVPVAQSDTRCEMDEGCADSGNGPKEPPSPLGATTTFASHACATGARMTHPQTSRTVVRAPSTAGCTSAPITSTLAGRIHARHVLRFVFKPLNGHARVKRRWETPRRADCARAHRGQWDSRMWNCAPTPSAFLLNSHGGG